MIGVQDNDRGCALCPRRCAVVRGSYDGGGVCGMGTTPRVARAMIHLGEEPCLTNSGGSGAVFFCGCALRCAYCQNAPISWDRPREYGRLYNVDELIHMFNDLVERGAQNINLVSATPFLPAVTAALRQARPTVPIVWNSSGYETIETIDALDGLVDIYLPDYKYSDAGVARDLSGAADYPEIAQAAILRMREQTGAAQYDGRGSMTRGAIVRHLILPGYIRESIQSLNWLADNLPAGTPVSLMGQFTPTANSARFGLTKPLAREAYNRVKAHRLAIGLTEGYNQSPSATGASMIPIWDKAE